MSNAKKESSAKGVTWDLDFLFKGIEDPNISQSVQELKDNATHFVKKYKGKIANNDITAGFLLQILQEYEEMNAQAIKIASYPSLLFAADTADDKIKRLKSNIESSIVEIKNKLVFLDLEINKISEEKLKELIQNPQLKNYKHYLEVLKEKKPHQLSEDVEQVINEKNMTGKDAFVDLYTEFTSSFKFEMPDGTVLSPAEIRALFRDSDPELRKDAVKTYYGEYQNNKLVLTNVYNNIIKDHSLKVKRRKYKDAIAPRHIANQVSHEIVDTMMNTVKKNYDIVQEYLKLKAEILYDKKTNKILSSDLYAPLTKDEKEYTFEEAKEFVLSSYREFDAEIGGYAERFFTDNLIDAEIRKTKRGGAFCAGLTPDVTPVILLSWKEKIDDVSTLAHEMGHGIHDFLAGKKQTLLNYHPPLVLAETASVFGEMIIIDKLLKELEDDKAKMELIAKQIEDVIGTAFRQVMYTFFELEVHERGGHARLSATELSDIWQSKIDQCYGDAVDWVDEHIWNWITIPHFQHTPFYCYSYAYAMLFVFGLYQQYKKEGKSFIPKLKNILEAGRSKYPEEIAKEVGFDVSSEEFWQGGLDYVRRLLDEFKTLI